MNVAILGTEQASQVVSEIIEQRYNLLLEKQGVEQLNVVAYVLNKSEVSVIDDKAVLTFEQFAALYRKKVIDVIIFPREIYFEIQKYALTLLRTFGIGMEPSLSPRV